MSKIGEVAAELSVGMDRIPFAPLATAMDSLDEAIVALRLVAGQCPDDAAELRAALDLLDGASRKLVQGENAFHQAREVLAHYGAAVLCAGDFVNLPDDTPRQPIRAGGEEEKALVTIAVDGAPRSFMWRSFDPAFIANADAFARAGLFAPARPLVAPDGGMLVEDVKADGSEIYGYSLAHAIVESMQNERARPDIDPIFVHYMGDPTTRDRIRVDLDVYVDRASMAGITLSDAIPELMVRPDGSRAWIVLDLGGADWCQAPLTAEDAANIAQVNRAIGHMAFIGLKNTADYLRHNVRTPGIA